MKLKELFEDVIRDANIFNNKEDIYGGISKSFFILDGGNIPKELTNIANLNGSITFNACFNLTSLIGCPEKIDIDFVIDRLADDNDNPRGLTSLEGAPKIVVGEVLINGCTSLTSLEGIGKDFFQEIGVDLYISGNIKSHILGILKIKHLKRVIVASNRNATELRQAVNIINKHLKSGRRLSKCREELIEAGLKEFAKL